MSAPVTQWFAGAKPKRKGWYERDWCNWVTQDYFDGRKWRERPRGFIYGMQDRPWRGLADKPTTAKEET